MEMRALNGSLLLRRILEEQQEVDRLRSRLTSRDLDTRRPHQCEITIPVHERNEGVEKQLMRTERQIMSWSHILILTTHDHKFPTFRISAIAHHERILPRRGDVSETKMLELEPGAQFHHHEEESS